jgi:hypothetical protein
MNFNTLFSVAMLPSTNITKATPPPWPPHAAGAMVGALTATPGLWGSAPTVASFSSRGGTPVNGGRNKPDITAPNGEHYGEHGRPEH